MQTLFGEDEAGALRRQANLRAKPQSHTAIETHQQCPARFRALYIEGEVEPEFGENLGSAVHSAIQKYHEGCLLLARGSDKRLAGDIAESLRQHPALEEADREQAAKLLLDYADSHQFGASTYSIEQSFEAEAGPYTFTGTPDSVEWDGQTLRIVDYKSFPFFGNTPEEAPVQLRRYAWLMMQALQREPEQVIVAIEYLPNRKVLEWELDLFDLGLVGIELQADIAAIEGERFWNPRIGPWCEYCGVTCPLAGSSPPVALKSEADAKELARFVTACGAQLGQIRKALHSYVREHGPLVVDGMRFEYRESVTTEYDTAALVTALEEAQVNWPTLLKLDKVALGKLGPALDEAGVDLADYQTGQTTSKRFSEGKADG